MQGQGVCTATHTHATCKHAQSICAWRTALRQASVYAVSRLVFRRVMQQRQWLSTSMAVRCHTRFMQRSVHAAPSKACRSSCKYPLQLLLGLRLCVNGLPAMAVALRRHLLNYLVGFELRSPGWLAGPLAGLAVPFLHCRRQKWAEQVWLHWAGVQETCDYLKCAAEQLPYRAIQVLHVMRDVQDDQPSPSLTLQSGSPSS